MAVEGVRVHLACLFHKECSDSDLHGHEGAQALHFVNQRQIGQVPRVKEDRLESLFSLAQLQGAAGHRLIIISYALFT